MTTTYQACLCLCGLSQTEAAALHRVSLRTVQRWCAGETEPSANAWHDLVILYDNARRAAEAILDGRSDATEETLALVRAMVRLR